MLHKSKKEKDLNNNAEFENILESISSMDVPESRSKEDAWNILMDNIQKEDDADKNFRPFTFRTAFSIAASIIIILGCWGTFRYLQMQYISTSNGQTAVVLLPDNSLIKLNSGSSIKYNRYRWKNNRHVVLKGEAFFNVVKGSKFSVESEGKKITVLGTNFNVYSRNQKFEVQCFSGNVKVEIPLIKPVMLNKGQAVKSNPAVTSVDTYNFNADQEAKWTKGEFYFDHEQLNYVFEELERQFNISIQMSEFKDRLYTGFFRKGSLKIALDNVCLPMGLKYETVDSIHIVIK